MIKTGDMFLDTISTEFQRMGDIDTFNNAVTWGFHTGIWRSIGAPRKIQDEEYAVAPWVATMKAQRTQAKEVT